MKDIFVIIFLWCFFSGTLEMLHGCSQKKYARAEIKVTNWDSIRKAHWDSLLMRSNHLHDSLDGLIYEQLRMADTMRNLRGKALEYAASGDKAKSIYYSNKADRYRAKFKQRWLGN